MTTEELIKKQTNWIKAVFGVLAGLLVAVIIACAILIPRITRTADAVEQSLTEIDVLVNDADKAIQNINNVDFEHLNQSINDLATITSKLAGIFGGN